jgi:hypothetical protein
MVGSISVSGPSGGGADGRLNDRKRHSMSKTKCFTIVASVAFVSLGSIAGQTQQAPPQSPNMTFFVTSTGPGKGADLGGLEGADRHCQTWAQTVGAGSKTWRAYLSIQAAGGAPAVNARESYWRRPLAEF